MIPFLVGPIQFWAAVSTAALVFCRRTAFPYQYVPFLIILILIEMRTLRVLAAFHAAPSDKNFSFYQVLVSNH